MPIGGTPGVGGVLAHRCDEGFVGQSELAAWGLENVFRKQQAHASTPWVAAG
jgi:hypothetical protein